MEQVIKHGATIDAATTDEIASLLREFSTAGHVAFGGDSIERELRNWPVEGHKRQIRATKTAGDDNFAVPAGAAVYTDLLPQEAGRGGTSLINIGANPVFVYLATAREAQDRGGKVACGYLAAGATWDGKIGGETWVGPISVRSVLGSTLVFGVI